MGALDEIITNCFLPLKNKQAKPKTKQQNRTLLTTVNTKGPGWFSPRPQARGWAGRAQGCTQSAGCTLMMGTGGCSLRDQLFLSRDPLAPLAQTRSCSPWLLKPLQATFSLGLAANCPHLLPTTSPFRDMGPVSRARRPHG